MKKNYFLFFLFLTSLSYSQIQSEGFEGNTIPAGWSTNIVSGNVDWTFGVDNFGGGSYYLNSNGVVFDDDEAGDTELNNTVELLSPVVDISAYSSVSLFFEYIFQDYSGSGEFYVEVWDGSAWQTVLGLTNDVPLTSATIDVSAYINAAFQVKFIYDDNDDWAWGVGIDNYSLSGVLSSQQFANGNFNFYPNPVANVLNINIDAVVDKINFITLEGKVINLGKPLNNSINVSSLSSGVYLVQIEVEGSVYTKKVFKQ